MRTTGSDFRLESSHITQMTLPADRQHQLTQTGTHPVRLGPISCRAQIIFIIASTVVMCIPRHHHNLQHGSSFYVPLHPISKRHGSVQFTGMKVLDALMYISTLSCLTSCKLAMVTHMIGSQGANHCQMTWSFQSVHVAEH